MNALKEQLTMPTMSNEAAIKAIQKTTKLESLKSILDNLTNCI